MSKINAENGHGIKLEGFLDIEIINKKDNVRRRYKNTITNGAKQFFLDKCAGMMLSIAADTYGMSACSNLLNKLGNSGSSPFGGRYAYMNRDITNVLLNMGDEANGLTGASTFLNPYDNNLAEPTKLVGYANNNIVPTQNGKEGSIDYCKGEYVLDPYTVCERWKYPEGVASGTIDTIAMMPAACVKSNIGQGVAFSKCLDKVNTQYTNYVGMSTGFLIPGVPGYTANDEILLNFNQDGVSKWKFSLTTGEVTAVPDTDPFFVVLNTDDGNQLFDMTVDGNYLYVLRSGISQSYGNMTVYVYDTTNNMNMVTSFTLQYGVRYEYRVGAKFLKIGSQMYVTQWCDATQLSSASGNFNKLYTLSKGSKAYYSSVGSTSPNYDSLGFVLPTGLSIYQVGLGNYNGQYIMFYNTPVIDETSEQSFGYLSAGITFTSLADPIGTMTGKVSGLTPNSVLFTAGSNAGFLRIGFNYNSSSGNYFGSTFDFTSALKAVINNSDPNSPEQINMLTNGLWMCLNGWYTDVISFVKLSNPITKSDTDIMYVSYGYKVV